MNAVAPGSGSGPASEPNAPPPSSNEVALKLLALHQQLIETVDRAHQELFRQHQQIVDLLTNANEVETVIHEDESAEPFTVSRGRIVR